MADIVMPRLSDSMEEGTILQWLKQVGEEVAVGEELVEIETDKANMAYEATLPGRSPRSSRRRGRRCRSGPRLRWSGIRMRAPAASAAGPVRAGRRCGRDPSSAATRGRGGGSNSRNSGRAGERPGRSRPPPPKADGRPKASPLARRLAKERGVELGQLVAPGPVAGS